MSMPCWRVLAVSAVMLTVNPFDGNVVMAEQTMKIEQQVEQAFQAARRGEFDRIGQLPALGPDVARFLSPYLRDAQVEIRREAVAVLAAVGGAAALTALVDALGDADADIRERAARALYANYPPTALTHHKTAGSALRASLSAGNRTAACLLLLGYFPDAANAAALRATLQEFGAEHTKLTDSAPLVSVTLPAQVALSQLGDSAAREDLLRAIPRTSVAETEFLLSVLRDIDSPTVLHAIKNMLGDGREIASGVPSGAGPRRRVQDAAVNALVDRLQLKVSFDLTDSRRYSDEQIAQTRALIDKSLPH